MRLVDGHPGVQHVAMCRADFQYVGDQFLQQQEAAQVEQADDDGQTGLGVTQADQQQDLVAGVGEETAVSQDLPAIEAHFVEVNDLHARLLVE